MAFSRLLDVFKGKTFARMTFNEALEGVSLSGSILDIGGVKRPLPTYYQSLGIERVEQVTAVNIDEACGADVVADAAHLPLSDALFDHGICFNTLEHVIDPDGLLVEAYRVLRPQARFLVMMPFLVRVHGHPHDYQRFTGEGLAHHLKMAGFTVERVVELGGGPFLAALSQIQIVIPRLCTLLFYPGCLFFDWLFLKLKPQHARSWPLGHIVFAKKV